MDEIEKALRKLSGKERAALKDILERIEAGNLKDLDLKKLKGRNDIFRVRKGGFRIIFRKVGETSLVLSLERRSDTTYRR